MANEGWVQIFNGATGVNQSGATWNNWHGSKLSISYPYYGVADYGYFENEGTLTNDAGGTDILTARVTAVPIPEPTTLLLTLLALAAVPLRVRRG